jgi:hercynylcysteine S-oxide lyase
MPNATAGSNIVFRNLLFENGDLIVYLSTAHPACEKTIQHICETTAVKCVRIDVKFPMANIPSVDLFRQTVEHLTQQDKKLRIAMIDTVVSFPGMLLSSQRLVLACKELKIPSLVDGAHGVGHLDLESLGQIEPDSFTRNCCKYVPCSVLFLGASRADGE